MKVEAPDEATGRKYLLWLPGNRLYHEPEELPRLTSRSLFANDAPLEVEAGCGTGEFLCAQAESRPETNFVGVDLHVKSLHRAVSQASGRKLENIVFARADFNLIPALLEPESLRAIYILFPDPGMKKRQQKKRVFSETFLKEAHRALEPGGRVFAMTDHEEYFEQMVELSRRAEGWEWGSGEELSAEQMTKTRFQSLWEGRGRMANALTLVKR